MLSVTQCFEFPARAKIIINLFIVCRCGYSKRENGREGSRVVQFES